MTNVADLVLAVKKSKEQYQFQLFDKIEYICKNSNLTFSENKTDNYIYILEGEKENLYLYLIQKELLNRDFFKHIIVQNLKKYRFFDYTHISSKNPDKKNKDRGRVDKYIKGNWEKLIENHYEEILFNIKKPQ